MFWLIKFPCSIVQEWRLYPALSNFIVFLQQNEFKVIWKRSHYCGFLKRVSMDYFTGCRLEVGTGLTHTPNRWFSSLMHIQLFWRLPSSLQTDGWHCCFCWRDNHWVPSCQDSRCPWCDSRSSSQITFADCSIVRMYQIKFNENKNSPVIIKGSSSIKLK